MGGNQDLTLVRNSIESQPQELSSNCAEIIWVSSYLDLSLLLIYKMRRYVYSSWLAASLYGSQWQPKKPCVKKIIENI
jgi:hypothetical protein